VNYRYRATPQFWKNFHGLPVAQKDLAREKFRIFHENPFDARLRTHKIQALSAMLKRTVHAVVIDGDLRAVFYIEGDVVVTFNIGTHDIYKT
jgi:hypothetical protein